MKKTSNPFNAPDKRLSPAQRAALLLLVQRGDLPVPEKGSVVSRTPTPIMTQTMASLTERGFALIDPNARQTSPFRGRKDSATTRRLDAAVAVEYWGLRIFEPGVA